MLKNTMLIEGHLHYSIVFCFRQLTVRPSPTIPCPPPPSPTPNQLTTPCRVPIKLSPTHRPLDTGNNLFTFLLRSEIVFFFSHSGECQITFATFLQIRYHHFYYLIYSQKNERTLQSIFPLISKSKVLYFYCYNMKKKYLTFLNLRKKLMQLPALI